MPGSSAFSSLPVRGVPYRCVGHPMVLTPQQTPQWLYVSSAVCHPRQFPSEFAWPRVAFSSWLVSLQVVLLCQPQPVPSQELLHTHTSGATALPSSGLNLSVGRALLQDCPPSVSGIRHLRHRRSNSSLYLLSLYSSEFSFPLSS